MKYPGKFLVSSIGVFALLCMMTVKTTEDIVLIEMGNVYPLESPIIIQGEESNSTQVFGGVQSAEPQCSRYITADTKRCGDRANTVVRMKTVLLLQQGEW